MDEPLGVLNSKGEIVAMASSQSLLSWMSPWALLMVWRWRDEPVLSQSLLSWMSPWAFNPIFSAFLVIVGLNPCCRG